MALDIDILAKTFDFLGKILIAFTALMVHHRFLSEHKVDRKVFASMKREQQVGVLGVILLTFGYILGLIAHYA